MHPIYHPAINRVVRTALRPVAGLLPRRLRFPVTGTIRVKLEGAGTFSMACNPTSYVAKVLFWEGVRGFEYDLFRIFRVLIRSARTFLDVGANIGYYSLAAATLNPDVRVVSFEPLPSAFHFLHRNVEINGFTNVTPELLALSDAGGETTFFVSRNPKFVDVAHNLASTGALDRDLAARSELVEAIPVRTDTLDHYVATRFREKVDLVKLDAEGSEGRILAGGATVLREHRPIILCEVLPGESGRGLEEIFTAHDYRMMRAVGGRLTPVEGLGHATSAENDHVMVPSERMAEVRAFVEG
jgi:FkbM family methyltransferase